MVEHNHTKHFYDRSDSMYLYIFILICTLQTSSFISILMGNTPQNSQVQASLPPSAFKVIAILNPEKQHLQLFTDYVIAPDLRTINLNNHQIQLTVYSILHATLRKQVLKINEKEIGVRFKIAKIRDSLLKITKIIPGSPCQNAGIEVNQYIVGLLHQEFYDLQSFANAIKKILATNAKFITLGICNTKGITRLVPIPVLSLNQWKIQRKGILGCELAEGWMNKFRPIPKQAKLIETNQQNIKVHLKQINQTNLLKESYSEITQRVEVEVEIAQKVEITQVEIQKVEVKQKAVQNSLNNSEKQGCPRTASAIKKPIIQQIDLSAKEQQNEFNQEQIYNKCSQVGLVDDFHSIQLVYKGILKNQVIDDASSICKCKLYDKYCQKCFSQTNQAYQFFNLKTHRIITIPKSMLLHIAY